MIFLEIKFEEIRNQLGENNYPPEFNPREWEKFPEATCYSYALDSKINKGILIGDIIEKRVTHSNSIHKQIEILIEELETLDLYVDTCDTLDLVEEGFLKIYIEWNEKGEYHFYRQDIDGIWSHKAAGTAPTRYDNQGFLIFNPDEIAENGKCFIISKF